MKAWQYKNCVKFNTNPSRILVHVVVLLLLLFLVLVQFADVLCAEFFFKNRLRVSPWLLARFLVHTQWFSNLLPYINFKGILKRLLFDCLQKKTIVFFHASTKVKKWIKNLKIGVSNVDKQLLFWPISS